MTTYRLYTDSSLKGLTGKFSLAKEAEYPDDSAARSELIGEALFGGALSEAYAVSISIRKVVGDAEEKVL
jgi:hypothetical protein